MSHHSIFHGIYPIVHVKMYLMRCQYLHLQLKEMQYNMFYSVTGLNNSLPNVTITVTVSNSGGQGNNKTFFVELPKPRGMYVSVCQYTHSYCMHAHTYNIFVPVLQLLLHHAYSYLVYAMLCNYMLFM